jgi:hypothetical protein
LTIHRSVSLVRTEKKREGVSGGAAEMVIRKSIDR